jgi:hypothetical protein
MFVPLDRPARLAAHANHKKACFYVNLDELKGDALLICHEWQIAFTPMKRSWWRANDGNFYGCGLLDVSAGNC